MILKTVNETHIVVDWAAVAVQLEAKVMARMRDSYDHWDEIGMRQMVVADAGDGLRICELLSTGSVDGVTAALWHMDTAPREEVIHWIAEIVDNHSDAMKQIW
jgi:hypothetical protein